MLDGMIEVPPPKCPRCVELGLPLTRVVNRLGPRDKKYRCREHYFERKREQKAKTKATYLVRQYGITKEEYATLYAAQGGKCFICQKATGATKDLAVDHQHDKPGCDHAPDIGCRNCVRCLACTTCNRIVLGRYDVNALIRAIEVLVKPPAQKVLNPDES